MGIEEIKKQNEQIEKRTLMRQEIALLEDKTNVEKLKHFNLISKEREKEIRAIYFERYYKEKWELEIETIKDKFIDPKKIAGTRHPAYYEGTLFNSVNSLKKFDNILHYFRINPDYYISNESRNKHKKKLNLAYKKHEDKYYINGEGNNRFITSIALGLPKILINEITVYDESQEIKSILLWVRENGFQYEIEQEIKSIQDSNQIQLFFDDIYITINGIEKLIIFKEKYENLDVSNFKLKIYKFKSKFLNDYRNKYHYSDEITHLFHANYLKLRKHKLKNK
ncbi:hypothetical protein [Priestia megaterium]|uniref:hypothetical protein n=1 Tax=Priestia megaterium TaxID=1404 RepID=UPI003C2F3657